MKNLLRYLALALVAVALVAGSVPAARKQASNTSGLIEKVGGGFIDWGKEMYYASGEGVMPTAAEEPNRARALLKAKGYAKMQAVANLLMAIEGTAISYEAYGKDYITQSETLKQEIEGFVKNVQVIKTEQAKVEGQTVVKVTVSTRMYGRGTPGSVLLGTIPEELAEKSVMSELAIAPARAPVKVEIPKVKPGPKPQPKVLPKAAPALERNAEMEPEMMLEEQPTAQPVVAKPAAVYTSVIIDTTGHNVARAMSPKIRRKDGSEVWGTIKMDPNDVQDRGPVAYVRTLADAKNSSRAGSNPLILKAYGRAGGARMCDVVLSDEDIDTLLEANSAAKPPFLDMMNVIFIVEPIKH